MSDMLDTVTLRKTNICMSLSEKDETLLRSPQPRKA